MAAIWEYVEKFWQSLQTIMANIWKGLGGVEVEQFAARYEFTFQLLMPLATFIAVLAALWLARRPRRRRAQIAATILDDDENAGLIRRRTIGIRVSNLGFVPIFVGHRSFAISDRFGRYRPTEVRGVAEAPPGTTLDARVNLEIPPGTSRVVLLHRISEFISANDSMIARWRKMRSRFRVILQSGEELTTRFSRYEISHLRDALFEERHPEVASAEARGHDIADFDPESGDFDEEKDRSSGRD